MTNQTGFYRVTIATRYGHKYYKYGINNQLVKKSFIRKDIYELKEAVEESGLLWGIIDIPKAQKHKGKYNLKALQGRYGEKIGD